MKKRYQDGGEVDAMDPLEEANKLYVSELMSKPALKEMGDAGIAEEAGQFGEAGSSRTVKATPKAAPKAAPKPVAKLIDPSNIKSGRRDYEESQRVPVDETKLSANERIKRSIEKNLSGARRGSGPTDKRSVTDRIKASLGMKSGGKVSASSRADGIAQRGKTRGKMC